MCLVVFNLKGENKGLTIINSCGINIFASAIMHVNFYSKSRSCSHFEKGEETPNDDHCSESGIKQCYCGPGACSLLWCNKIGVNTS